MAPQTPTAAAVGTPGLDGAWEVLLGLVVVVALIVIAGWLLRRVYPGVAGGTGQLRVLATLPLGPRERLLLVDAAGKQLLLGVTAQQVTTLHTFDEALPLAAVRPVEFATRLREVLGKGAVS